jgi:predicted RND superfamily exporter protein
MVWLPRNADIRIASETIDKKLGTMANMEVLVGVQNVKKDARLTVLQGMEELHRQIEESPIPSVPVNQIRSVVDVVTLAGKALGRETNMNRLPTDPDQLSRDIALMELCAPILLREFTDHRIQIMRFTIHLPWMDAVVYGPFLDRVRSICKTLFKNGETIAITGRIPLLVTTLNVTIGSMVRSYLICGLVISGMMILLMKNATLGMLGMIPNIIPVWLSLGIMGWAGFPLDMYTLLVGSIALGLIVDDTVHLMHYFQSCSRQGQSIFRTCILTLQSVGPPMLMTTILIVSGALVLLSATMNSLKYFGAAIAGVSLLALVCDLIMVPAIMTLVMGRVNTTKYPRLFLSDNRRKS